MEKIKLTPEEKETSNEACRCLFGSLATSGVLTEVSTIAPNMLLPIWFSMDGQPELVKPFHDAERLHWQDPDLPTLMTPYEGNTKYLVLLDPEREVAIHGFRMCFPLGRSEADKVEGLVGLPVVDDLILGSHLVNGPRKELTVEDLSNFYRDVELSDRPDGINFPEDSATIESTFRMFFPEVEEGVEPKRYVLPPVDFGYVELTRRSTNLSVRALMTYINEATEANLRGYSIRFSDIMDDPTMPPVDRRADGTIKGRLGGYKAVTIIWDELNRAVLGPAADVIHTTVDLTGEMIAKNNEAVA